MNSEDKVFDLYVQNFDPEVDFAIMELHEITTEGGNNKWNKAVFSVQPDGAFDM